MPKKLNREATIKILVFIILPTVLAVLLYLLYKYYLVDSPFINKVILKKDMEFKYFTYDEFDSPKGEGDTNVKVYSKKGKYYIENSGKENFSPATIKMLDDARDIIEREWNKFNTLSKIYFVINSAYRTDSRNAEVGGVPNSAHRNKEGRLARAVDISWSRYNDEQRRVIVEALERVGFKRMGFANSFIHVDNDETLPQTTWVYKSYSGVKYR